MVLEAGHPSPLNRAGFRGARPFSAANKALADAGRPLIDWDLRTGDCGLGSVVLVLALDTSTPASTAALVEVTADGMKGVAERRTVDPRAHGELLAPEIAAVLAEAGVRPRDLAAIVAGLGPGPFTGLRVGLATAASMGQALGIPTYGVCSLDAWAAPPARAGCWSRPTRGGGRSTARPMRDGVRGRGPGCGQARRRWHAVVAGQADSRRSARAR